LAGIYIHIPFCRHKCHYCNFFSLASGKFKEPFLQALKKEIAITRDYLAGEPIDTVYFGGGTPSLYSPGELQEILELVAANAEPFPSGNTSPPVPSPTGEGRSLTPNGEGGMLSEVTMELNPEDVTKEYAEALKHTGFNRFSLGVQSFADEDLTYLNRSHSAGRAIWAVRLLQEAGYENISIDLIYGIPTSSPVIWQKNLEMAFSLGVPHISAYALTIEPRTPLAWSIGKQKSAPVSEEVQADQFRVLMQSMKQQGFLQYEISNFCKPGRYALHNTSYWKGIPYLGLGPSAHSYNRTSRRWNISNVSEYIARIDNNECIYEEELLTATQKYNEYVMTSLRTMWGCDGRKIISDFGFTTYDFFRKNAFSGIAKGLLAENSGVYFLTEEGKFFADRIASELFLI
jgi:oxygen-independent coproporphyrinogen III oxidase